jgi:hypothetical protein
VHNNPLRYVDPSGHYCVSSDGNNAHGGSCDTEGSYYMGSDNGKYDGYPIIGNGILKGYVNRDSYVSGDSKINYWDTYSGEKDYYYRKELARELYITVGEVSQNRAAELLIGWHYYRNVSNIAPGTESSAIDKGWKKLPDSQSVYHQMGYGNENNAKYISPDGKLEAVYNADGSLVTDIRNVGTYNYSPPGDGFSHFIKDVVPYYVMGNSPDDPTTMLDLWNATVQSIFGK